MDYLKEAQDLLMARSENMHDLTWEESGRAMEAQALAAAQIAIAEQLKRIADALEESNKLHAVSITIQGQGMTYDDMGKLILDALKGGE